MTVHVESGGSRDDVKVFTIDRPERRNAVDHKTLESLRQSLADVVKASSLCRALVLTGAHENFCAGADLTTVEDDGFVELLRSVLVGLKEAPFPVIAAIEGVALGAGTQLAVACDLRVASASASFGIPAARLGLTVDQWTVHQLALQAGGGPARAMLIGGELLSGLDLHSVGFVHRLAGGGDAHDDTPVRDAALRWASTLADLAPLTLTAHKAMLNATEPLFAPDPDAEDARSRAWRSADLQEGLAAFRERRSPRFHGN